MGRCSTRAGAGEKLSSSESRSRSSVRNTCAGMASVATVWNGETASGPRTPHSRCWPRSGSVRIPAWVCTKRPMSRLGRRADDGRQRRRALVRRPPARRRPATGPGRRQTAHSELRLDQRVHCGPRSGADRGRLHRRVRRRVHPRHATGTRRRGGEQRRVTRHGAPSRPGIRRPGLGGRTRRDRRDGQERQSAGRPAVALPDPGRPGQGRPLRAWRIARLQFVG